MAATPRPAASILVLRDVEGGIEVLFVRRAPELKFMGGAWVFPGGSLHASDGDEAEELTWKRAAARETHEEAGIELGDPRTFVPFSRWITPELVPMRFDTRFYLAESPPGAEPSPDRREVDRAEWWSPAKALELYVSGDAELHFPTVKQIEKIAEFESVAAALRAHKGVEIEPILPRVVTTGDDFEILLPGDAGYDAAG